MARLLPSLALTSVLACSAIFSAPARAAEPTAAELPPDETPATPGRRWYGVQTLAFDGAAVGFGVLSGVSDAKASRNLFGITAAGTYLLGGPFVHFVHGHIGKGLGSFGLRVGAPLATLLIGAALGAAATSNDGAWGRLGDAITGASYVMLFGAVMASIVDFAIIAHEDVPRETPADTRRANANANASAPAFAPTIAVSREAQGNGARTTLGLAGTF